MRIQHLLSLIIILSTSLGANPSFPLFSKEQFFQYWTPGVESAFQSLRLEDYINSRVKFRDISKESKTDSSGQIISLEPVAHYYLAHIYLRLNQLERANSHLNSLKEFEGFSSAYQQVYACYKVSVAWQLLRKRDWEKAYRLFEEALFLEPSQELKDAISQLYLQRTQFMKRGRDLAWKEQLLQTSQRLNQYHEETLLELSRLYLDRMDFARAVETLESLTERFPTESRLFQLAEVYRYTNQLEDSYRIFHQLHLQNPGNQDYLRPVLELRSQGVEGKIQESPKTEQNTGPMRFPGIQPRLGQISHSQKHSKEVESLLEQDNFSEARSKLEEWKVQYGISDEWLALNLNYYRLQKDYQGALDFLAQNKSQFSSSDLFHENRVKILSYKDPTDAKAYIEQLLRDGSVVGKEDEFRLLLVKIQLQSNMLEDAREVLNELVSNQSASWEALFYQGVLATQEQNFPAALDSYMKANEMKPDEPKTILAIATTLQQLGHTREAMAFFTDLFLRFPDSKFTNYARSLVPRDFDPQLHEVDGFLLWESFERLGSGTWTKTEKLLDSWFGALESTRQWDLLIEVLEQAIFQNPEREDLRHKLEDLYENYVHLDFSYFLPEEDMLQKLTVLKQNSESGAQKVQEFLNFLHPAVEISPKIRYEIALFLKEQDYLDSAITLFESLLEQKGYEANSYAQLGYCYFTKKDLEAALNAYYQAIHLQPDNTELLFKLAELLKQKGELQRARLVYLEIIQLESNPKAVEDARFFLSHLEKEISTTPTGGQAQVDIKGTGEL